MIVIDNVNNLDLCNTITCGQIFRFEVLDDGAYIVVLKDRVVWLKYDLNKLYVDSNKLDDLENVIINYLDLNRDYVSIIDSIKGKDDLLDEYLDKSIGLKIIRQDIIECIISYVISQNNSVRNIQNSLNLISEMYGEKVEFMGKCYYLFPTLDKLSKITLEDYRKCKVGFRDKYLFDIVKYLSDKSFDIEKIKSLSSTDALKYLMSFKGIGMKVASCILLFAYQRFDVFPIDTWVKKFMLENYNINNEKDIRKYAVDNYKEYSGLVIQYMFNAMRNM